MSWYTRKIAELGEKLDDCDVVIIEKPNLTEDVARPRHKVTIPSNRLLVGEIFDLDDMASDCSDDYIYEFQFVAPILAFSNALASPVNPITIK